jgi:hypothetical protein
VRTAAVLGALAMVAGTQPGAAGAQLPTARPHSKVVTYDRGDVHVQRLQMSVARSSGMLHARARLTVRNETRRPLTRELRVGRCTGGEPAAPVCPPSRTVRVRLGAGEQRSYATRVTMRQPSARIDAVQAALVRPSARQPYGFRSDGLLLLKGTAWRGGGAGRVYGVAFAPGDGARRLNFDIPRTGPGQAYIDVKWEGAAAPTGAATTISRCAAGTCTPTTLTPARGRSGPGTFGDRFDFDARGADSLALAAAAGGAPLFEAALPWPR